MPQSGEQVSWFLSCRFRTVRRVRFAPAACMRVRRALHHRQSCRRKTAILPASTWNGWHQCQNRPEPRVLESCFAKLPHGGFVRGSKPFFALDVPHARASSAALDGRTSRTSRRSHDTRYSFPHDPRTIESRSRNIPCWPFLSRETQVHRLNSSVQRLRIAPALRGRNGDLSPV